MAYALILIAAVAVAVLAVTASLGVRERRVEKALAELSHVDEVDMGITLHVVRKEPLTGEELIPGLPKMKLVATHYLGGMVTIDARGASLSGPSENPAVWFASEEQAALILHADDASPWLLIEGSEGAGKTTTLAMWLAVRALEHVGTSAEIGMTAPTHGRLAHIKKGIRETWPKSWYRYRKSEELYTFHAGPRVQLVSAVKRSESGGSPIQGYTWVAAASDELQDHFEREADIEARCRDPRANGRAKRLCSSTPKDSSEWRTFREACRTSKPIDGDIVSQWSVRKLLGMDSPFIHDAHWQRMRASGTMTDREWRRRILAMDVGPERQVYYNWKRGLNLSQVPLDAVDVTAEVMAPWGRNVGLLIGHDPGTRQHVSVLLKAYRLARQPNRDSRPRWFVVGEVTSPESTIEAHARHVLRVAREEWHCNTLDRTGRRPDPEAAQVLVRIDPHTRGEADAHPGSDVAVLWRSLGMIATSAAYVAGSSSPAQIKRRQRIDMINTLLSATSQVGEVRRLFVACDEHGKPSAPMLVKAIESMEFDLAGRAEAERKDADDLSHWPAALGYALWSNERPRGLAMPEEMAA